MLVQKLRERSIFLRYQFRPGKTLYSCLHKNATFFCAEKILLRIGDVERKGSHNPSSALLHETVTSVSLRGWAGGRHLFPRSKMALSLPLSLAPRSATAAAVAAARLLVDLSKGR